MRLGDRRWQLHRLDRLGVDHLPFTLKVLLENLLRHEDGQLVTPGEIDAVRRWDPAAGRRDEVDLHPTRVFLHDTNGVPALVDLAAMRDALAELGADPPVTGDDDPGPPRAEEPAPAVEVVLEGRRHRLGHGKVAIAAITSCTTPPTPR